MRILLAEDNELNQDLAVRLLTKHGHEVTVVDDGAAAVDFYAADPDAFDVILMDLNMPRMGGRAAARIIRTSQGGARRVPILAMTATASRSEIKRALRAGMDGCIEKPIDVKHMLATIERAARGEFETDATPAGTGPPVAWDDALRLVGGDEALLAMLARRFLGKEDALLGAIRAAVAGADGEALEDAAHKLRGSLGNFAADAAYDWARRLEHLGAAGDLDAAPAALAQLEAQMADVRSALAKHVPPDGDSGA